MPHKLPSTDATPDPDSPAPVVRRISNPRLKKPAKKPVADAVATADAITPADQAPAEPASSPAPADSDSSPAAMPTAPAPSPAASPPLSAESEPDRDAPPADGDDWPEPEAPATPGQENKRKRRRRKGKGQGQGPGGNFQAAGSPVAEETHSLAEPAAAADATKPHRPPQPQPQGNAPRQPAHRPKLDPETLATKAWKIYLAEVSEEGVALIGDQDARELARRCFRLAEIFIEEQARRNLV